MQITLCLLLELSSNIFFIFLTTPCFSRHNHDCSSVARVNDIARAEEDIPDRLTDLVAEIIEEQSKQNLEAGTRIREGKNTNL
jgi:hypothetical protein